MATSRADLSAAVPGRAYRLSSRRFSGQPWCIVAPNRGSGVTVYARLEESVHRDVIAWGCQGYTLRYQRATEHDEGGLRIRFHNRRDLAMWIMRWG